MAESLDERVSRFVVERDLLRPADRVLLMVSGGPDSMCLLHLMPRIHSGPVGVVAMDHGLRVGGRDEVASVCEAAAALGLHAVAVDLGLSPGAALHERARDARYAQARRVASEGGYDRIATGHTASDQAETVLFRIARGTGRDGAVGMGPAGPITRPLLCASRSETRAWCDANGVPYVDDPSNDDPGFARARVRNDLVPALLAVHPQADRAVTRFAELLDDEAALLRPLIDAAWERCAADAGLRVDPLLAEDVALRRLLVRRLLAAAGITADAARVDSALRAARDGVRRIDLEGGRVGAWRGVLVAEPLPVEPPRPVALDVPGEVPFGPVRIRASRVVAAEPRPDRVDVRVGGELVVRGSRPGDRIALAGGGRQTVGRLLSGAGVPVGHRPSVPVVTCAGRVVWVSGYRADVDVLAPPGTPATRLELL